MKDQQQQLPFPFQVRIKKKHNEIERNSSVYILSTINKVKYRATVTFVHVITSRTHPRVKISLAKRTFVLASVATETFATSYKLHLAINALTILLVTSRPLDSREFVPGNINATMARVLAAGQDYKEPRAAKFNFSQIPSRKSHFFPLLCVCTVFSPASSSRLSLRS